MGFDDLCNTVLGLGFSSSTTEHHKSLISPHQPKIIFEPSLTLTLSGDTNHSAIKKFNESDELYSGAASSFSSVKREREMVSEQTEIGRVSLSRTISDIVEDEDGGINGRKKLRLTKAQSALLEEKFKKQSSLNPKQKQELARGLKLRPRQVEVWFQNRRARTKLKQTEVDCEFLKKCCEKLTDENQRLQKELQDLKALTHRPPHYMQLPAATLTMCPSCEKIGSSEADEKASKSAFATKPKSHIYNQFTNSSAAC